MFDWFKRLFGEGYIHFTGKTVDGKSMKGKIEYTGDVSTLDTNELEDTIRVQCWQKYGERVSTIEIGRIEQWN